MTVVNDDVKTLMLPLAEMPGKIRVPSIKTGRGRASPDVTIRPPGSKSLTNRALLLAALADGTSVLRHALAGAVDTERMLAAIQALGAEVSRDEDGTLRVVGVGGSWKMPPEGMTVDLQNAGTAVRFLSASGLIAPSPLTVDGNERMRQRPIGELADSLRKLGCTVEFLKDEDRPPIRITPPEGGRPSTSTASFSTTQSSQFISALLLVAPCVPGGLTVRLEDEITSQTYVQMTVNLLDDVGVTVRTSDDLSVIRVSEGLKGFELSIEPDASAATYHWATAALLPDAISRVSGLDDGSLQGDFEFVDVLARMGVPVLRRDDQPDVVACKGPERLTPILADMAGMPDAAVTLAVVAAFANGTSIIRGVRTLRVKECDRIAALQTELAKIGVVVQDNVHGDDDVMTITPPTIDGRVGVDCGPDVPEVEFDTYDDHRMAMALALVGLRRPNVWIRDPGCVSKTYPGYWKDLAKVYGV